MQFIIEFKLLGTCSENYWTVQILILSWHQIKWEQKNAGFKIKTLKLETKESYRRQTTLTITHQTYSASGG